MARVMYCSMEQSELEKAVKIAGDMKIDLFPYLVEQDNAICCQKIVESAYEKHVDAILCRGRILAFLRNTSCMVPIVPNYFAGKETIGILYLIKQRMDELDLNGKPPKVCLLSHQPLYINEQIYNEVFCMDVHNIVVPQSRLGDMEAFLRELKEDAYDCIACGRSVQPIAQAVGLPAFCDFQETMEDAIYDGLRTASVVAASTEELKKNTKNVQTMMDYAFEAVLMTDEQGKVTLMNRRAKLRLGLTEEDSPGGYLWELIPQLCQEDIRKVLNDGQNIWGDIVQLKDFSAVVNVSAIQTYQKVTGAVVQFTELRQIEKMESAVKKEIYAKGHVAKYHFHDIIGTSQAIEEAKRFANQFAKYHSNVLIIGETGNGKEIFAQSIHNASLRKEMPFVAVNCGAIPQSLIESELFGYVDGAFTGASRKGKKGLMEIADGGTIFLDEVSELDLSGQVQLLRVLEERVIRKVGDNKVIPVDFRVIAATNRNLRQYVEEGKFRKDLYYRLNVLTLNVPPLRKRGEDIILLAKDFIKHYGKEYRKLVSLTPGAEKILCSYSWPGNVRQLRNFCERIIVVAEQELLDETFVSRQLQESFMLKPDEIQELINIGNAFEASGGNDKEFQQNQEMAGECGKEKEQQKDAVEEANFGQDFRQMEELSEKELIQEALNRFGGNRKESAKALGMSKSTLWRKMKKYDIEERF